MSESKLYGEDTHTYKETESYKIKSNLYAKLISEINGNKFEIDEDSIFGLLDLK